MTWIFLVYLVYVKIATIKLAYSKMKGVAKSTKKIH